MATATPISEAGNQMAQVIEEAWRATASLDEVVDGETRQSAFVLVLEAMLRNAASAEPKVDANLADSFDDSYQVVEQDDLYPTPGLRAEAISAYLDIQPEQVPLLCSVEQAAPDLRLRPTRLAPTNPAAAREIALLLLGVRTAVALDTQLDDIRQAVERYCQGDEPPFAAALQSSPEWVVMGVRGSERKIVRLREPGVTAARTLAQRLVAG